MLKNFSATTHPRKDSNPITVLWTTPRLGWIKVNTDGASRGCPGLAASGGIFRDSQGCFLRAFAGFIGFAIAARAKLQAAMLAIEMAYHRG